MADQNKSLLIGTKVDEKGLKSFSSTLADIKKAVSELNAKVTNLNKAFQDLGSKLNVDAKGITGFNKNILDANKGIEASIKTTKAYIEQIKLLYKALHGKNAAGLPMGGGNGGNGGMGGLTGMQIIPIPGGGFTLIPGPGGGPGGGGRGGGGGGFYGGAANDNKEIDPADRLRKIMNGGRMLQYGANAGASFAGFLQNMKISPYANEAIVQSVRGSMFNRMLGGDLTDALTFQRAASHNLDIARQFGGRDSLRFQNSLGGIGTVGQGLASGDKISGTLGAVNGASGVFSKEASGDIEAQEAQSIASGMKAAEHINPVQTAVFQNLQRLAPALLDANRRLNNRGREAVNLGGIAQLTPTEAMSFFTNTANRFGSNAAMGGLGTSVLGMQEKGFDQSTMLNLMGTLQGRLNGTTSQRLGESEKMLKQAMSLGIKEGITDRATLEALSKAIVDANMTSTGPGNQSGSLAAALIGGMNGQTANPQQIQERYQGLQALSQGMTSNPGLRARGFSLATKILGPNASLANRLALSGSSIVDILKNSRELRSMGISSQQEGSYISGLEKIMVNAAVGRDPLLKAAFNKSGGNINDFLKNNSARMATVLSREVGGFGDRESVFKGLGALDAFNQNGGKITPDLLKQFEGLDTPGGIAKTIKGKQAGVQQQGFNEAFTDDNVKAFNQALNSVDLMFDKIATMPNNGIDDAVKLVQALEDLVRTVNSYPKTPQTIREVLQKAGINYSTLPTGTKL